jgi:hypothetical protein
MACNNCNNCTTPCSTIDATEQCINCRDICDCLVFTSTDGTALITRTDCTIDVKFDCDSVNCTADVHINAGTAIAVTGDGSSGTPFVITNTGVTSVNGNTGAVTIDGSETKVTAGTNVTVTGLGTIASPYVINSTGGVPSPLCADTIKPYADALCCKTLENATHHQSGLTAAPNLVTCRLDIKIKSAQKFTFNFLTGFSAHGGVGTNNRVGMEVIYRENIYTKFRGWMTWGAAATVTSAWTPCFNTIISLNPQTVPGAGIAYPANHIYREWIVQGLDGASEQLFPFILRTDGAGNWMIRGLVGVVYKVGATNYYINMENIIFETV